MFHIIPPLPAQRALLELRARATAEVYVHQSAAIMVEAQEALADLEADSRLDDLNWWAARARLLHVIATQEADIVRADGLVEWH